MNQESFGAAGVAMPTPSGVVLVALIYMKGKT